MFYPEWKKNHHRIHRKNTQKVVKAKMRGDQPGLILQQCRQQMVSEILLELSHRNLGTQGVRPAADPYQTETNDAPLAEGYCSGPPGRG
jgi:hypothetical protein